MGYNYNIFLPCQIFFLSPNQQRQQGVSHMDSSSKLASITYLFLEFLHTGVCSVSIITVTKQY